MPTKDHARESFSGPASSRRRDSAATRAAILGSAISAFTRHGYDGVGVREIARDAGVTAMLVNRYFGSKEQLFAEAVDVSFAPRTSVPTDPTTLAQVLASRLVEHTAHGSEELDPFLLALRSAANPRAAEIITESLQRNAGRAISGLLDGEATGERAMLAHALIAGIWLMRNIFAVPQLVDADPEQLTVRIEQMLATVLSPPSGEPAPADR